MISRETVLDDLNLKFTSKFNHGCLYCAILKALYGFKEKIAHRARDNQFIFQNVQNEISEILKIFKTTEQPVELIQKLATETTTPQS